jgi:hypothetical protein
VKLLNTQEFPYVGYLIGWPGSFIIVAEFREITGLGYLITAKVLFILFQLFGFVSLHGWEGRFLGTIKLGSLSAEWLLL